MEDQCVHLTQRQINVLRFAAAGLSAADAAKRLGVSARSVRAVVRRACARLGARTLCQAVAVAIMRGLLEGENDAAG